MLDISIQSGGRVLMFRKIYKFFKYLQKFEKNYCFHFTVEGNVIEYVAYSSLNVPFVT
jgi:hypothetical protein